MKTQKDNTLKSLSIAVATVAILLATDAGASGRYGAGGDAEVIYQSRSANHAIHSYPSSTAGEISLQPELIYVSQAYGPAIYSYRHSGSEQTVPFNVEYTDTAYGQAIHSYERPQLEGEVKVLPIVVD